jgi:hypothetical protein
MLTAKCNAWRAPLVCVILFLFWESLFGQIQSGRVTTQLEVRLSTPLSSATAKDNETFEARVVRVVRGDPVDPDTPVVGKVIYAKPEGKLSSPGILTLQLMSVGGTSVDSSRLHWVGRSGEDPPSSKAEAVIETATVLNFGVKPAAGGERRRGERD